MSRLTKKIKYPKYMNDYEQLCNFDYHIINKLGQIEDLLEKYNVETIEELEKIFRNKGM